MPPNHQKYSSWNGERFRKWARSYGLNTYAVVNFFLTRDKVEQQGYKSCMTLLKLADKYSPQRLEEACKRALSYTPRPSLKSILTILRSRQDILLTENESEEGDTSSQYAFTRGSDYYSGDDD